MAEISFPFTAVKSVVDGVTTFDRIAKSEDYRQMMKSLVSNGVYADPTNNLQVVKGTGAMEVILKSGWAWVEGAFYWNTEDISFTLDTASGTNDRIDTIVIRFSTEQAYRSNKAYKITGVANADASPTAPARNSNTYELVLAQIKVPKGSTSITTANITDTRFVKSLCGIAAGVINQIDTTDLFAQYDSRFTIFFNDIKNTLGTDAAGNLLNLINSLTETVTTLSGTVSSNQNVINADNTVKSQLFGVKLDGDAVYKKEKDIIPFAVAATSIGGVKDTDYAHLNSNGQVQILKKGIYQVDFLCHSSAMVANNVLHVGIWKNKTTTPVLIAENYVRRAGRTDICSGTASGLVQCSVGDLLSGYTCNEKDDYHYRLSGEHCKFRVYLLKDLS